MSIPRYGQKVAFYPPHHKMGLVYRVRPNVVEMLWNLGLITEGRDCYGEPGNRRWYVMRDEEPHHLYIHKPWSKFPWVVVEERK